MEHPHGLNDKDFDMLFTKDKPIIFAFRLSFINSPPHYRRMNVTITIGYFNKN